MNLLHFKLIYNKDDLIKVMKRGKTNERKEEKEKDTKEKEEMDTNEKRERQIIENDTIVENVKLDVKSLCKFFPLYRELHD